EAGRHPGEQGAGRESSRRAVRLDGGETDRRGQARGFDVGFGPARSAWRRDDANRQTRRARRFGASSRSFGDGGVAGKARRGSAPRAARPTASAGPPPGGRPPAAKTPMNAPANERLERAPAPSRQPPPTRAAPPSEPRGRAEAAPAPESKGHNNEAAPPRHGG